MTNIRINYTERQIEVTAAYLKKASVFGTEEFKVLKQIRDSEPTFKVVAKTAKRNNKKNTYSNLTFEAMKAHIVRFETDEAERTTRLKEFSEIRKYAAARKAEYPKKHTTTPLFHQAAPAIMKQKSHNTYST